MVIVYISVCLVAGILPLQGHQPGVVVSVVGRISLYQVGLQSWLPPDSGGISSPVEMINVATKVMSCNINQQFEAQLFQCLGDGVVGFVHGADVEVSGHEDGLALAVVNHPLENTDKLSLVALG